LFIYSTTTINTDTYPADSESHSHIEHHDSSDDPLPHWRKEGRRGLRTGSREGSRRATRRYRRGRGLGLRGQLSRVVNASNGRTSTTGGITPPSIGANIWSVVRATKGRTCHVTDASAGNGSATREATAELIPIQEQDVQLCGSRERRQSSAQLVV